MYDSWDMKFNNRRNFLVILGNFLLFYLPNNLKNENIKNEKNPGDIIILHKCAKKHDHLLYCSRDMAHDRCNGYFHFGLSGIFPITFLQLVNGRKNSILNRVIKLNLIKLHMKLYISKKNCCRCRQTISRLCLWSYWAPPTLSAGALEPPIKFSKREVGAWQDLNF